VTPPGAAIAVDLLDERVAPRTTLGESPRWAAGRWWWLDAHDGRIWSSHGLATRPAALANANRRISLVQPAGSDFALVADGAMIRPLRRAVPGWEFGDPLGLGLGLGPGWVLNDGCADAAGRLWIGAVPRDPGSEDGVLLCIDGRQVVVAHDAISISNGMAWSVDGETLFHVDTGRAQLLAHRVDPRQGTILATEVVWHCDDGLPDGLAMDRAGGVWVAVYGTGQVRRIRSGEPELVVEVPTPQVTSVALGGPDGCDMLITTAREGFTADQSEHDPAAGRLFRARSPHPGTETPLVRRNRWTR
jgi:D-xylonolactonase